MEYNNRVFTLLDFLATQISTSSVVFDICAVIFTRSQSGDRWTEMLPVPERTISVNQCNFPAK